MVAPVSFGSCVQGPCYHHLAEAGGGGGFTHPSPVCAMLWCPVPCKGVPHVLCRAAGTWSCVVHCCGALRSTSPVLCCARLCCDNVMVSAGLSKSVQSETTEQIGANRVKQSVQVYCKATRVDSGNVRGAGLIFGKWGPRVQGKVRRTQDESVKVFRCLLSWRFALMLA